ncbi:hypothetical protein ARMSODRAFT_1083334 [Armillaria solidipes]|uniref:Uncharacterized protein n=1 Tax=Armillaria solidipes TaxID=1076256 RepID=A0A2H3C2K9_9AGAR|nr:hypothetical protein ARMSODRAFT_1083334 [Armillaria solidipes]
MSVQSSDKLYLPGTTLRFQCQAQGSNTFGPLAATVTSATDRLVQRHFDHEKVILKLADCRLWHRSNKVPPDTMPRTPSMDDHLRRTVRDTQAALWEDWMWEVSTWFGNNMELAAYRLLHRLQGRYIPRLFSVVRRSITPEPTPLNPMTDAVQGLVLEYISGDRCISGTGCSLHDYD